MSKDKVVQNEVATSGAENVTSGRDEYVLRRGVIITDRNLFSIKKVSNSNEKQYVFGHNDIIIPVATLEAIRMYIDDYKGKGMKKMIGERANEYLSSIEKEAFTENGYPRGNGSFIKIVDCEAISAEVKKINGLSAYDQRVLQVCKDRSEAKKKAGDTGKIILISSNIAMRYHATKLAVDLDLNITAKAYEDDMYPEPSKQYKGLIQVEMDVMSFHTLREKKEVKYECVVDYQSKKWYNNMFVIVKTSENGSAIAVYSHGKLKIFNESGLDMSGIEPLNLEQKFFSYSFKKSSEECSIIIARGAAGTGKTILAMAGALANLNSKLVHRMYYDTSNEQKTPDNPKDKHSTDHAGKKSTDSGNGSSSQSTGNVNGFSEEQLKKIPTLKIGSPDGEFDQIIITTPLVNVSDGEIGFLPGGKQEKTEPYFGGIMDNLGKIIHKTNPDYTPKQVKNTVVRLFSTGIIEIIPILYMRGRSFEDKCVILDEGQNVEPDDILDIVSRLGANSKLIVLGDPQQTNKVGLNKRCNGIVYTIEGLKEFEGCYVITFSDNKIQRSPLAKYAVQHLL